MRTGRPLSSKSKVNVEVRARGLSPIAVAEKSVIEEILKKHHGNICAASEELMMNRNTVAKRIDLYKIDIRSIRESSMAGRKPLSKNGVWPQ